MTDTLDDLMPSFRSEYDEKSLGMLSDILSTLYANPERSVLREYIANAIDAHQLAGQTRPVEVTLPTHQSPTLVIQDFGDGLDMEGLRNTFFKYVASTKTSDDSQIGALGIGAKSAFALTKSWTVTNVHDGLKYVIASVNDPYGPPKQSVIVNGEPTSDPSGITVSIPINDRYMRHEWVASATRLVRWFPKGSVAFAQQPARSVDTTHWSEKYQQYGNVVWDHRQDSWRSSYGSEDMYVVMCGIAYAIDSTTKQSISEFVRADIKDVLVAAEGKARYELRNTSSTAAQRSAFADGYTYDEKVAREVHAHAKLLELFVNRVFANTVMVDAGDIDFMPSRESVKGTPRTVDTIGSAVLDTISKFSTELVALRKLDPPQRVKAARKFFANVLPEASETTVLDAVGIHNLMTNVYRKTDVMGLHGLLGKTKGDSRVTLVTGMSTSAPLYKINVIERQIGHNGVFFTTPSDTAEVPGFGSIAELFSGAHHMFDPVMSVDEYKAVAKALAPASRSGGTVVHRWWRMTPDADDVVEFGNDTFDDLMDSLADEDITVYVTDIMNVNPIESAARKGVEGIVIFRGRRQVETFDRELGRKTRSMGHLQIDAERSWMKRCVEAAKSQTPEALRQIATYRAVSEHYVGAVKAVLDSDYGDLVMTDHAARRFVEDYVRGGQRVENDRALAAKVVAILDAVTYQNNLSEHVPDDVRAIMELVVAEPWPLITRSVGQNCDPKELRHAAVYLAAVG